MRRKKIISTPCNGTIISMAAFIDKVKIKIESGKGGNGAVAWRREKFVDKGGPAGGDGGKGGSIYFVADENMSTLLDFTYKSVYRAEDGENGQNKNCHGKNGKDIFLKTPVGVIVRDLKSGKIIADLNENEKTILVAKGGRGGRGNARFATAQKRAPQFCEPGEASVERELELELRLIADVGLLGMPNAGKSSFISKISSARPKIADYPFTTLVPNLGVVKKPSGDGFVVADIPGIIEGAHKGTGLGFEFLKHVQRCRFLIHVVDISNENAIENYNKINDELKKYSEGLSSLYQVVMLNKTDILDDNYVKDMKKNFKKFNNDVYAVSCATGQGIEEFLNHLYKKVDEIPHPENPLNIEYDDGFDDNDDSNYTVVKLNKNTFLVDGGKIRRLAGVTDIRNTQQMRRLANILDSMGVYQELKKLGLKEYDTIMVAHIETSYIGDYQ